MRRRTNQPDLLQFRFLSVYGQVLLAKCATCSSTSFLKIKISTLFVIAVFVDPFQ
jgi:hypothetical protein